MWSTITSAARAGPPTRSTPSRRGSGRSSGSSPKETSKDIAQQLHISLKTVEAHRAQLMERLGVHDVAGLVRFAVRVGLVSPEA